MRKKRKRQSILNKGLSWRRHHVQKKTINQSFCHQLKFCLQMTYWLRFGNAETVIHSCWSFQKKVWVALKISPALLGPTNWFFLVILKRGLAWLKTMSYWENTGYHDHCATFNSRWHCQLEKCALHTLCRMAIMIFSFHDTRVHIRKWNGSNTVN